METFCIFMYFLVEKKKKKEKRHPGHWDTSFFIGV